jgi:SecY translocase
VGLSPFFLAYLLVECVAAAPPRLRALRHGSAVERAPLTLAAWALALALAAVQAWNIAAYLQTLRDTHGEPLLAPGAANLLGVTSTLVLGAASAGWAALLVSRHGVGNGFAVLFAGVAAEDLQGRGVLRTPRQRRLDRRPPPSSGSRSWSYRSCWHTSSGIEARVHASRYQPAGSIGAVLGSGKRRTSFAIYAMGLLGSAERKSVEPLAALG